MRSKHDQFTPLTSHNKLINRSRQSLHKLFVSHLLVTCKASANQTVAICSHRDDFRR